MSRPPFFKRWLTALPVLLLVALGLGLGLALPASAATKVRIEYVRLLRGGENGAPNGQILALLTGSAEAVTASASSVQSTAAPAFAADRQYSDGVYARIIAVQGAAIVTVGANPVASETSGVRISVGDAPLYLPVSSGQKVAVIESADAPPATGGGGGGGGSGDASAANQVITNSRLGDAVASPLQYSLADRLKVINLSLANLFPAGGLIGNTAFGATQSGPWTVGATQSGPWIFGGDVASGAADSGNPIKVGGVYIAPGSLPTLTSGWRSNLYLDQKGNLRTTLVTTDGTTGINIGAPTNSFSFATAALTTKGFGLLYNGTSADVQVAANQTMNTTGTGLPVYNNAAQFDDVSPTSITENNFGNLRMSQNRNLYNQIRDAAGSERGANVTLRNGLAVDPTPSGSGTITSVTCATSSTALLAANSARIGGSFWNDGSSTAYIALASSASLTAYTVQLAAGGYFELPARYAGAVTTVCSAASGSIRATEY